MTVLVITDPKAPQMLQKLFLVAAQCEDDRAMRAIAEDVVRMRKDRIPVTLRLSITHPMAHRAQAIFEGLGVLAHCNLV